MRAHTQQVRVSLRSRTQGRARPDAAADAASSRPTQRVHVADRRARASRGSARRSRSPHVVLHAERPEPRRRARRARPGRRARRRRRRAARHAPARRRSSSTARGCRRAACRSTRTRRCPSSRSRPRSPAKLLSTIARGHDAAVSIGAGHDARERRRRDRSRRSRRPVSPTTVASSPTSSRRAWRSRRREPRLGARIRATTYGTVNGSSAAAAAVAGAAAVLAEARPPLGAAELRSVLVGNRAAGSPAASVTSEGAGLVALGAAAAAELVAEPTTLAFGNARARRLAALAGRRRPQRLDAPAARARAVRAVRTGRGAASQFRVFSTLRASSLPTGKTQRVRARRGGASSRRSATAPAEGSVVLAPFARCSASAAVGGHVRAAVRQRARPAAALDRLVHAVDAGARAADVPCRAARRRGGARRRSSPSRCSASTCSTDERHRPRHARHAARPAARAATRSASPAAAPPGNTLGKGRYRHPRDRRAEPSRAGRASPRSTFTIK